MAPKLILTGFMATGKSSVARALARRLSWRQIDCDAEIVARAGRSIPEIFRTSGETHFRELEHQVIAALAADTARCPHCDAPRPAVVALGGGAMIDPRNYAIFARLGLIICLVARPEIIAQRVGRSAKSRPLLMQGGPPLLQRITEMIEARRATYARADLTIDTSDRDLEQVVDAILTALTARRTDSWPLSA